MPSHGVTIFSTFLQNGLLTYVMYPYCLEILSQLYQGKG